MSDVTLAPLVNTVPFNELMAADDNVRTIFDDVSIGELAESIKAVGLLNPLTVVQADDKWKVIAGNRRYFALARLVEQNVIAGDADVAVIVQTAHESADVVTTMLVENLQRENLSPFDEGAGFQRLLDLGFKQKDVAAKVGKAASHVTKRLALLRLPIEVRQVVLNGGLPLDVAYDLSRVSDEAMFNKLCAQATKGRLETYQIATALATAERVEKAARLTKELFKREIGTTADVPPRSETEIVGTFDVDTIKTYEPARGHIVHRASEQSTAVTVYRKLTAKQIEARNAAVRAEQEERAAAATPHELWEREVEALEQAHTDAWESWERRWDQLTIEAIMKASAADVKKMVLAAVTQTAVTSVRNPAHLIDMLGLDRSHLGPYDTAAFRAMLSEFAPSENDLLQLFLANTVLTSDVTIPSLVAAVKALADADGLVEPQQPELPIEPWLDETTGEWVTDRPYEPQREPDPEFVDTNDEDVSQDGEAA